MIDKGAQLELVEKLISKGMSFNYENFSSKTRNGYPESYTPDFIAWRTRCGSIILKLFGNQSPHYKAFQLAYNISVLGNGPDKFMQLLSTITGVLNLAKETLGNDVFMELKTESEAESAHYTNEVFIVHGHDETLKHETEIFLTELGLNPIVLHRKADEGQTIIEKFEKYSNVGYAFVLLTPDEVAYLAEEENKTDSERKCERRARPNVVFEFGYFVGKLGRSRVCCLYKEGVSLPSDVNGMIYKKIDKKIEDVGYAIMKDLKAAGYTLKL